MKNIIRKMSGRNMLKRFMIMVVFLLFISSIAYAAGITRTWVNAATSANTKYIAYYLNDDSYILTEDTYNRGTPIDSIINALGAGYTTGVNCQAGGLNWPNTLVTGNSYNIWITDVTNSTAGSDSGTYNSISDNTTTLGSGPGVRLTLTGGTFLATPAFSVYPGNTTVLITWEAASGADTYVIYKRTASSPKGQPGNNWIAYQKLYTASVAGSYSDTSLTNGTNYYYLILAKAGSTKVSAHSDEKQVQPSGAPTPVVTSVAPNTGNNGGATSGIIVKGAGFTGVTAMKLQPGAINLPTYTFNTDNQITLTVQSGITAGTYYVEVTANGSSVTGEANKFTVTESTNPPNTPGSFISTGKTTNTISWQWADVAGEDWYGLFNSSSTLIVTMPANATSTVEGSAPNTRHQRKLASHNQYGYSGYTSLLDYFTYAFAPTNLTAESVDPSTIKIYWQVSVGGNEPTRYEVQRAPDVGGNPGAWTSLTTSWTNKYYPDGSCPSQNTKYHYQVRGFNGQSDATNFSNVTFETTKSGPPTAPTLQTTSKGVSTTSIQWDILDNSDNELSFAIYDTSNVTKAANVPAQPGTGLTVSTTETGLSSGTPVTRKAGASNAGGRTYSVILTRSPLAAVPTGLTATTYSTKDVDLSWSAATGASSYKIYYRDTIDGTPWDGVLATPASSPYRDSFSLTAGAKRYYAIRSVNADGTENMTDSTHANATTMPLIPAPTGVTGEVMGTTSIQWRCVDQQPDGTTTEAGYWLLDGSYAQVSGSQQTPAKAGTGQTVSFTEGSLSPCRTYTRYWKAYRANNDSTISTGTTRSASPETPGQPTFNSNTTTAITFNLVPATNYPANLLYVVETATQAAGPWTSLNPGYAGTNTFYTHSGLDPLSAHYYRTFAKNPEGVIAGPSTVSGQLMTQGGGTDTQAPSIEAVFIGGKRFVTGDIISANVNMSIRVKDIPYPGGIGVTAPTGTVEVYVDEGTSYVQTRALSRTEGDQYYGTWSVSFSFPPEAQQIKAHSFRILARDGNANSKELSMTGVIITGAVQIVGTPLNYPNPFKPLAAVDNTTQIQYSLSSDAGVTIIMYDITGQEVKRWIFTPGQDGGKAGLNSVSWNGRSVFGEVVGNGMYIYKIVSGGKVVATGKLVVLD